MSSSAEPGTLGFLVVAGMGVILVFLFRSMSKHLRKVSGGAGKGFPRPDGPDGPDGPAGPGGPDALAGPASPDAPAVVDGWIQASAADDPGRGGDAPG